MKSSQVKQESTKVRGVERKKPFKRKNKKKKNKEGFSNPAQLPKGKDDASSNWKALLEELKSERGRKAEVKRKKIVKVPSKERGPRPEAASIASHYAKKPDIWFDDVDEMLLDPEDREAITGVETVESVQPSEINTATKTSKDGLVKEKSFNGLTKVIGIDCEMVGVGHRGEDSILARISLVNHFGHCIYDKFVRPTEKVVDYRTPVSGIRSQDIEHGADFKDVQLEVAEILRGRILVGHSLKHDLRVLFLDHPKRDIRDTASYKPFRAAFGGKTPSLKRVTERFLGVKVQEGEHSSVQDAQAAVRLYTMFRKEWEKNLDGRKSSKNRKKLLGKKLDVDPNIKLIRGARKAVTTPKAAPAYEDSDESD